MIKHLDCAEGCRFEASGSLPCIGKCRVLLDEVAHYSESSAGEPNEPDKVSASLAELPRAAGPDATPIYNDARFTGSGV